MKFNKQKLTVYIFLICFLFFYRDIYCKELYINNENREIDFINPSISPSTKLLTEEDDFDVEIEKRTININKVQTVFLKESIIYRFNFLESEHKSDLLVNFYPLDCKIDIAISKDAGNNITIQTISNYEYDAFSVFIKEDIINSSYIKIKPLINILEENNKKREYHLVINSIYNDYKDYPQLELNEKEPTLIYFDSNLKKIKLTYQPLIQNEPVVFSFFIKERAKFEAKIMDDENTKRIIAYKDNIILNPNSITKTGVYLTIDKINDKKSTLIVKVSGNSTHPYYLQKNILNLGFMPINTFYHYYYMEVFKGEKGEIMIHNKIHDSFLMGKILQKKDIYENNILNIDANNNFPKYGEKSIFTYNYYSKKLDFSPEQIDICDDGCYLLITYYSPKINLENIDGIEYNLLTRIWEQEKIQPQIVNIPLNEYVFGTIDFYKNNYHYYSLYIPENDDITIEIQGRNIYALAKKGYIKINPFNQDAISIGPTKSNKTI